MNPEPLKVLLVEDNPGDARLIQEMLAEQEQTGFDLECADRLSTGLERLASGGIALVLLDLSLPDSQGLDTVARLLAHIPHVPIIVLTGLSDEVLALEAVRKGAQDYLVKGQVDGPLLAHALRYALARKRAESALARRTRELSVLYTIAQTTAQTFDLQELLDITLDKVLEGMNAEIGGIALLESDGQTLKLQAHRGLSEEMRRDLQFLKMGEGLAGRIAAEQQVMTLDLAEYPLQEGDPLIARAEIQSMAGAPLVAKGRVLGVVCLFSRRLHLFPPETRDALASIGQHLGTAVDNARLYEETRNSRDAVLNMLEDLEETVHQLRARTEQLSAINELNRQISSNLNIEDTYQTFVEMATSLVAFDCTALWLVDEEAQTWEVAARWTRTDSHLPVGRRLPVQGTAMERLLAERRPWLEGELGEGGEFSENQALRQEGVRSRVLLPLIASDRLLGALSFCSYQPGTYSADDLEVLAPLAAQMVVAVENSRLYAAVRQELVRREQAEKTLRESEARLRRIFETMNEGMVWIAPDGQITYANPAAERILGLERSAIESRTYLSPEWEVLRPDGTPMPPEERAVPRAMKEKRPIKDVALGVKRPDGSIAWLNLSAAPLLDEAGQVQGVVASYADVTERKQLEQQFHQAQKMEAVGRLAGGVAHDFNNLLTIVGGYSELLLRHLRADDPHHSILQEIQQAADRGAGLIRQLLAFSRKQVLEPVVLNLNAVVRDLEKMLRRLIGEDVELVVALAPDLGQVKADPGQLEQVLMNLAVNARDAMPRGGQLTIKTSNAELDEIYTANHMAVKPGPYALLEVSDTGTGMEANTQAHIFEPFFTTKEPGKGTGLGLSTVYGIVKQSEGYIWVYSELGQGTSFKIYLPRVEEVAAPAVQAEATLPAGGSETVLLVEDEAPLRGLMAVLLREAGYTVLEASQGEEALRLAAQHQGALPLIVTDMVMPGMSGRELAEQLTAAHPCLKVLYISGYSAEVVERQGSLEPGTLFLQKPFKSNALLLKVREALDRKG